MSTKVRRSSVEFVPKETWLLSYYGCRCQQRFREFQIVSGRDFEVQLGPRREGDSPVLVADNSLAQHVLGWSPSHDLKSIIETALNWHANHLPRG